MMVMTRTRRRSCRQRSRPSTPSLWSSKRHGGSRSKHHDPGQPHPSCPRALSPREPRRWRQSRWPLRQVRLASHTGGPCDHRES
jgi:hypothetical protein